MGFALKFAGKNKDEVAAQVAEAARILELGPLLDRKPKDLSGGQRQRVAIGRAIVRHPEVFLFDEPLSNLDAELRVHMRIEIARLHKNLKATIIYVTHDQVEAMTLADKIVVLRDGVVEQVGAPLKLYDDPDNLFVAGFIGSPKMNFLHGTVQGNSVTLSEFSGQSLPLPPLTATLPEAAQVTVGLRPDLFRRGGAATLNLVIEIVEHLGGETYAYAWQDGGQVLTIAVDEGRDLKPGQSLSARFDASKALLFDAASKRLR